MFDIINPSTTGRRGATDEPAENRIRRALSRLELAIERKPGFGRSTKISTTTVTEGLRCISREGDHLVVTDLGPVLGGNNLGPTPSALLRAALGSCLTMGYRLRAARRGIPLAGIRVEIETESMIEGLLDPDSEFPPGFTGIRYRVDIDSPASEQAVEQLIAEADRLSPLLDAVTRVNRVERLPSVSTTGRGGR